TYRRSCHPRSRMARVVFGRRAGDRTQATFGVRVQVQRRACLTAGAVSLTNKFGMAKGEGYFSIKVELGAAGFPETLKSSLSSFSFPRELVVLTDAARFTLLGLVQRACDVVTPSRFSASGSRRGIAFYDTLRDKPITELAEFAGAVAALQADPVIAAIFGPDNARRLAI